MNIFTTANNIIFQVKFFYYFHTLQNIIMNKLIFYLLTFYKFPNSITCNNEKFIFLRKFIFNNFYNYHWNLPGSAITPTLAATLSPKDRLIANPGTSSSFNQTLAGPINWSSSSLNGSILPPLLLILSASSGSLGLWSLVKSWDFHSK